MIKKYQCIEKILECGVIAVLRSKSELEVELVSRACIDGGINIIEVTFSVPNADVAIRNLKDKFKNEVVVGAGTVLDPVTARIAILAGAEFIVSPNFNIDVAFICNFYCIPYVPGCMTINEISDAYKYGVDIVKLFPGDQFKSNYIKNIKAPLPQVNIMVTGGVNIDNASEWIINGAVVIGVGGNLTNVKDNNYGQITELAKEYVEQVRFGRNISYKENI